MKQALLLIAFVIVSAVSFKAGHDSAILNASVSSYSDSIQAVKDYQVACKLSDIIRNIMDNTDGIELLNIEDIYGNHVDNLDCDNSLIITVDDIESTRYCWSY